ncbi:hypothetical protein DL96DRAFT_1709758 [Flagelloscypha sp. PMI_526]|nr:hypothetical protein DL96DRAFT_1709758 [Flagelloscypha sp. PMI_526]
MSPDQSPYICEDLQLSALVILYWDHILTFGDEVRYLWSYPITLGSWLFFINRYTAFIFNVIVFYNAALYGPSKPFKEHVMTRLMVIDAISWPNTTSICFVASQAIVAGQLYLQSVFTHYGVVQNVSSAFLCVLVVLIVTLAVWTLVTAPEDNAPEDNTCPQPGISSEIASRHALLWGCLMSFDVAIFVLTVLRTWRSFYSGSHRRSNMPLTDLLLRDGAMYFLAIVVAYAANVGTFFVGSLTKLLNFNLISEKLHSSQLRGCLSTFGSTIATTLASRVIINLHKTADRDMVGTTLTLRTSIIRTPMQFRHSTTIHCDFATTGD